MCDCSKTISLNEVHVFSIKYCCYNSDILLKNNNINFIDSAGLTFWIIRIFDFNRAEPTCHRTNFPYASSGYQNGAFWYIVLRIMLLTYTRAMIRFSNCCGLSQMDETVSLLHNGVCLIKHLNLSKSYYNSFMRNIL